MRLFQGCMIIHSNIVFGLISPKLYYQFWFPRGQKEWQVLVKSLSRRKFTSYYF